MYTSMIETPIGPLTICSDGTAIKALRFGIWEETDNPELPLLKQCAQQLQEYFAGERRQFDLPLAPDGTPFQRSVWQALCQIPYGETRSYGEIAAQVGNPKAARAVGMANNRNPIPILIPCHRVIGASGKLIGYAGGLGVKETLLCLESRNLIQK